MGIPETNEGGRTYWKEAEALSRVGGLGTELAGSVETNGLLRAESGGNVGQLGTELAGSVGTKALLKAEAEAVREVGN